MTENEKNTVTEISEKTSDNSLGCLFWPYTIVSLITGILFVIWLIQGRPDTWYGTLFRLQFKVLLGILIVIVSIAVIYFVMNKIISGIRKREAKENSRKNHEEKQ